MEASRAYESLKAGRGGAADSVWIDFRIADTRWRLAVARTPVDEAAVDAARESLEALRETLISSFSPGRVFAEINESLAGLWLKRPQKGPSWDFPQRARPYLAAARKWWFENSGAQDRDARFLRLFWLSQEQFETRIPILEMREALVLASSNDERAHLRFLIAKTLEGNVRESAAAVEREYEAGLSLGATKWREALLFGLAEFLRYCGRSEPGPYGVICKPDHDRALAVLRQMRAETDRARPGSHYYVDQEIAKIAGSSATLWIPGTFLPGTPAEITLTQKNLSHCEIALYELRVPEDFEGMTASVGNAFPRLATTPLDRRVPIRRWSPQVAGQTNEDLVGKIEIGPLEAGLYFLLLRSDAGDSRWPLLVSDISILLTRVGDRSCLFVARSTDGRPIAGADVTVFPPAAAAGASSTALRSDADGIVGLPDGDGSGSGGPGLVFARSGANVAFVSPYPPQPAVPLEVDVRAFTAKSTYRAGEKIAIAFAARSWNGFVTGRPGDSLAYEVRLADAVISSGRVLLDERGEGSATFLLSGTAEPGIYRVRFPAIVRTDVPAYVRTEDQALFRVASSAPRDLHVEVVPSRRIPAGPSESSNVHVLVRVEEEGKPVEGASVDLTVVKRTFEPGKQGRRLDRRTQNHWSDLPGTTDSCGEAEISFPVQAYPFCNLEYEIHAAAQGPNGKHSLGRGRIRVGAASSYARFALEKAVARPGEAVRISISTFDSAGEPVRAMGFLAGRRRTWTEAWTSPDGRRVEGDELRRLKARGSFPWGVLTGVGAPRWKVATHAWSEERIFSVPFDTGTAGSTDVSVSIPTTGRVELSLERGKHARASPFWDAWAAAVGGPADTPPSGAAAVLWVADDTRAGSFYQPESLEIVLSKDTARPGETITALLVTPLVDRDVLLSISDAGRTEWRVVHVDGNTKPVAISFPEGGTERVSISGAMVSEGLVFQCRKELDIDPGLKRMRVEVVSNGSVDQGAATIRLTGADGNRVQGRVSVALVDDDDEPALDPFLPTRVPSLPLTSRQSSLSARPIVGSGAGSDTVVQPPCGRSRDSLLVGHGTPSCEPNAYESRNEALEGLWSLDVEVPRVLFESKGNADENGEARFIGLPACRSSRCRLRVWASGRAHEFGFADWKIPALAP